MLRIIVLQGLRGLIEQSWDGFRGSMSDYEGLGWILRDYDYGLWETEGDYEKLRGLWEIEGDYGKLKVIMRNWRGLWEIEGDYEKLKGIMRN